MSVVAFLLGAKRALRRVIMENKVNGVRTLFTGRNRFQTNPINSHETADAKKHLIIENEYTRLVC